MEFFTQIYMLDISIDAKYTITLAQSTPKKKIEIHIKNIQSYQTAIPLLLQLLQAQAQIIIATQLAKAIVKNVL